MNKIDSVVASYVSNWLKVNQKSYSWLAEELAVSKSLVQHMLSGTRTFTSERILKVADILGISIEELTGGDQKERGYTVQLKGNISTVEGKSSLENVIFSCLKDAEIRYANEIVKKG